MIDSHAHLYFDRFDDDRPEVIARARSAGVEAVINIGIDAPTSRLAVQLARENDGFFAAVGLHPTSRLDDLAGSLEEIEGLAAQWPQHVVAIGEIGLDFYWDDVAPDEQRARLAAQLELAERLDLPVVYHCRDALDELLEILERRESQPPGVFHCFSGTPDHARRALALGYHVSFAGNVTFPKSTALREAALAVPVDRLLLETDCPFLAPQPKRGRRNEPAFVAFTCEALAALHGVAADELARRTRESTIRLFRLPLAQRG